MTILVAGLIIWIGIHCVPMRIELRSRLVDAMGEKAYKGLFALVSFLGLGLIIWGKGNAEIVEIWQPSEWLHIATKMLMFPAVLLIVAAYGPDNFFRRILGHPMILGVEIWAIAHLLANGDLALIILFGTFLLWALAAFASSSRRQSPKGGKAKGLNNVIILGIAAVAYIGLMHGHQWFAGVGLF